MTESGWKQELRPPGEGHMNRGPAAGIGNLNYDRIPILLVRPAGPRLLQGFGGRLVLEGLAVGRDTGGFLALHMDLEQEGACGRRIRTFAGGHSNLQSVSRRLDGDLLPQRHAVLEVEAEAVIFVVVP